MTATANPGTNRGVHRFAVATAGATFLLVIAGGLVTSHRAGLAVPDWPLSFGQVMPPMEGGVFYEHGHRLVASFVGLLTIVLAVWLSRSEPRPWVRYLGWLALAAVIVQGVLGGLTVLLRLPPAVSIVHACVAQLFFSLTVCLALVTGQEWHSDIPKQEESMSPTLSRLAWFTSGAIFVQLFLGSALRHAALGILPHLLGAGLVTLGIGLTAERVLLSHRSVAALRRPAQALLGLLGLQVLLGVAAWWAQLTWTAPAAPTLAYVVFTTAHVAVGALMLATSLVLAVEALRRTARPAVTPSAEPALEMPVA